MTFMNHDDGDRVVILYARSKQSWYTMLERMVLHMSGLERRGAGYGRPNTCFDILGQHVVDVRAILCIRILLAANDVRAKAGTRSDAMICGSHHLIIAMAVRLSHRLERPSNGICSVWFR